MRLFIFAFTVFLLNSQAVKTPLEKSITETSLYASRSDLSSATAAFTAFTAVFDKRTNGLPENVRVLGVRIRDGKLTVNLSEEFLFYGGNENERVFIETLKETARNFHDVTHLTLLIEGQLKTLTEGRLVNETPL